MMGFVNGLAIVIFLSQMEMFMKKVGGEHVWLQGQEMYIMLGLVLLTMAIMFLLPKLTKAIPSALTAIIVAACITIFGGLDVSTVGSFVREGGGSGLQGSLPTFQFQIFGLIDSMNGHWFSILSFAFVLSAVGLIESLMTLNLVDELTETRGSGNIECVAQGAGNFINGLFGGMGGCAMIGQSIININSGGRGRLSGLAAAIALLCFILFGAPLIEQIPIAALVGVMFMVVIGTFAWSSFRVINKIPISDALVLIAVSAITVVFNLAVAVISGVIISALVFAWKNATMIRARKSIKEDGTKVYEIWGPLFFGSSQTFNTKFDPKTDPNRIEIDFIESKVVDHSGIEALRSVVNKYLDLGKEVSLTHLSPDCKALLHKRNPEFDDIIQTSVDDPRYYVVTDQIDKEV
jgi:SulP family sulfate permease